MTKMDTRDLVFTEAFKLFSKKPYDQVTYTDLEKATGLSRGAILYHIKNKKNLFGIVVSEFILKKSSIPELSFQNGDSLINFIDRFLENSRLEKKNLKKRGIENINLSMLNLSSQAFYYCPVMAERYSEWMRSQLSTWTKIIRIAIDKGEIRNDMSADLIASLFHNVYFGLAYSGSVLPNGYDLEALEKEFKTIYSFISCK